MNPRIYCLSDPKKVPKLFKVDEQSESDNVYDCVVDDFDEQSQLVIFTFGLWCKEISAVEIKFITSASLTNDLVERKLCTLSVKQRSFVFKIEDQNDWSLPLNHQVKLQAKLIGTKKKENQISSFSSPIPAQLPEGEVMKLVNETTPMIPTMNTESEGATQTISTNCKTPLRRKRGRKDDIMSSPTDNQSSMASRKRPLDKENLCVTPKLKTSRGRSASRLTMQKNTSSSNSLTLNDECQKDDSRLLSHDKPNVARCVSLPSRAPKPSSRWGHSMCMIDDHNAILIGGQGDKMQLSKDSIWQLDTESRTWKSLTVTTDGIKPENRTGHSATYDETVRCIYVYGGSKNSKWFHDVHMYDLDEQKWTLVKANGKAPTRAYHSATLYRHELWIFGGVFPRPVPQPDGCDNELHIFSPVMEGWYKPIVTGEKPAPRSGHSANLVDDKLVLFGGWDFPFCYSDIHILDLTTLDWSSPNFIGEAPKPRCWSTSCTLTNRRVFIQGGYDGDNPLNDAFIFDLDQLMWQKLAIDVAPSPRAGHAGICLYSRYDNENEDEILVFGGGDNDGIFFSDMYSFYIPYVSTTAD